MVIVKLFRREDANKIRLSKKGLKGMNLSPLGINSTVYINDSLCTYHKILWSKCRKLFLKKYIHSFWVANGTNKLKTVENWLGYAVTHRNDLRELFPDCYIIDFIVHVSSQFLQSTFYWSCFIFISFSPQSISFISSTIVHLIHIYFTLFSCTHTYYMVI